MSSGDELTKTNLWQHQIYQLQAAIAADEQAVLQLMQDVLASKTQSGLTSKEGTHDTQSAVSGQGRGSKASSQSSCYEAGTSHDRILLWAMGIESN